MEQCWRRYASADCSIAGRSKNRDDGSRAQGERAGRTYRADAYSFDIAANAKASMWRGTRPPASRRARPTRHCAWLRTSTAAGWLEQSTRRCQPVLIGGSMGTGSYNANPPCPASQCGLTYVISGCSLIPGVGSKLSMNIGCRVLSAVGACPPHDGVRSRWWINV
jgi:hypothetical protein